MDKRIKIIFSLLIMLLLFMALITITQQVTRGSPGPSLLQPQLDYVKQLAYQYNLRLPETEKTLVFSITETDYIAQNNIRAFFASGCGKRPDLKEFACKIPIINQVSMKAVFGPIGYERGFIRNDSDTGFEKGTDFAASAVACSAKINGLDVIADEILPGGNSLPLLMGGTDCTNLYRINDSQDIIINNTGPDAYLYVVVGKNSFALWVTRENNYRE